MLKIWIFENQISIDISRHIRIIFKYFNILLTYARIFPHINAMDVDVWHILYFFLFFYINKRPGSSPLRVLIYIYIYIYTYISIRIPARRSSPFFDINVCVLQTFSLESLWMRARGRGGVFSLCERKPHRTVAAPPCSRSERERFLYIYIYIYLSIYIYIYIYKYI